MGNQAWTNERWKFRFEMRLAAHCHGELTPGLPEQSTPLSSVLSQPPDSSQSHGLSPPVSGGHLGSFGFSGPPPGGGPLDELGMAIAWVEDKVSSDQGKTIKNPVKRQEKIFESSNAFVAFGIFHPS